MEFIGAFFVFFSTFWGMAFLAVLLCLGFFDYSLGGNTKGWKGGYLFFWIAVCLIVAFGVGWYYSDLSTEALQTRSVIGPAVSFYKGATFLGFLKWAGIYVGIGLLYSFPAAWMHFRDVIKEMTELLKDRRENFRDLPAYTMEECFRNALAYRGPIVVCKDSSWKIDQPPVYSIDSSGLASSVMYWTACWPGCVMSNILHDFFRHLVEVFTEKLRRIYDAILASVVNSVTKGS